MILLSYHSCNLSRVWELKVSSLKWDLSFFFSERIQNHRFIFKKKKKRNLSLVCNTRHSQTLCFFEITNSSGSWRHQLHLTALQRCVLSQDSICLVMFYCLNSIWGKLLSAKTKYLGGGGKAQLRGKYMDSFRSVNLGSKWCFPPPPV